MFSPIKSCSHKAILPLYSPKTKKQFSKLTKLVLAHSFGYQIKEHRALRRFGEICVLIGTSTAGKTSIIKALLSKDPARVEKGLDMCEFENMHKYLKSNHPEEFAFLQTVLEPKKTGMEDLHVLDAIGPKIFAFKKGISESDQRKAQEIAEHLFQHLNENVKAENTCRDMMEDVLCLSVCGKATVFDIMEVEEIFDYALQRGFHSPIKTALVYCPFSKLAERITERNRKALESQEYHEFRGTGPLFQFSQYFVPKGRKSDVVVETINRKMVEDSFDICFNMELALMKERDPLSYAKTDFEKDRQEAKELLLLRLGFTNSSIDNVELTPKFKRFDFLINTSQTKPDHSADLLKTKE